jgi:hypothetical protein
MEQGNPQWTFKGFSSPNFTSVPDEFFDELAPRLNGGEVKVLLYIIRRTFGFKKERDCISLSQMLNGIVRRNGERLDNGAGLSKPSLCRALNTLVEKQVIIATRQYDYNGSNMATAYQLNMRGRVEEATLGKKMRQGGLSQTLPKGESQNLTKGLVKKRDIQDTDNNIQLDKNVNVSSKGKGRANYLHLLPDALTESAHIDLIAGDILAALGDAQSTAFYHLVARKVPEETIRRCLSELKAGRVRSKPKVFTGTMMHYAAEHVAKETDVRTARIAEDRATLLARLRYR